jgi:ABC-type transport system substrate-binding protein
MRYEIHTVAGWTDWEATAGIIAQSLADVGIAATVVPLPYKTWNDRLQSGSFDMGSGPRRAGRRPTSSIATKWTAPW